jgi:hypothetical protein
MANPTVISHGGTPNQDIPDDFTYVPSGEEQLDQFQDEYDPRAALDDIDRKVWNSTTEVKIKQAESLLKELTAQSVHKKISKFKTGDIFERYARDLKAELITVPLCANRLDKGHLVHPRRIPNPRSSIFCSIDDNGAAVFDSKGYGNCLMLCTLVEDIRAKISSLIFATVTYSMQENLAGQEVIRSDVSKDFYQLFQRLKERFQINSDIEKERLLQEFHSLARNKSESLRNFYGRTVGLVAELRSVFHRDILDEDVKRTFFKQLTEGDRNSYLQLQSIATYASSINDLCLEIIRRHEELEPMNSNFKTELVNYAYNYDSGEKGFKRICHNCKKVAQLPKIFLSLPNHISKIQTVI